MGGKTANDDGGEDYNNYEQVLDAWKKAREEENEKLVETLERILDEWIDDPEKGCPEDIVSHRQILENDHEEED